MRRIATHVLPSAVFRESHAAASIPVPTGGLRYDRLVFDAKLPFARFTTYLEAFGLDLVQRIPAEGVDAKVAIWRGAVGTVALRTVASAHLSLVELRGAVAREIYDSIVMDGGLSPLLVADVLLLLASRDSTEQMKGLIAAEHLGVHGDERVLAPAVAALADAKDEDVRERARVVSEVLYARVADHGPESY